jgi:hypothetical protein
MTHGEWRNTGPRRIPMKEIATALPIRESENAPDSQCDRDMRQGPG